MSPTTVYGEALRFFRLYWSCKLPDFGAVCVSSSSLTGAGGTILPSSSVTGAKVVPSVSASTVVTPSAGGFSLSITL